MNLLVIVNNTNLVFLRKCCSFQTLWRPNASPSA